MNKKFNTGDRVIVKSSLKSGINYTGEIISSHLWNNYRVEILSSIYVIKENRLVLDTQWYRDQLLNKILQ